MAAGKVRITPGGGVSPSDEDNVVPLSAEEQETDDMGNLVSFLGKVVSSKQGRYISNCQVELNVNSTSKRSLRTNTYHSTGQTSTTVE